jgi:hypothetical protein
MSDNDKAMQPPEIWGAEKRESSLPLSVVFDSLYEPGEARDRNFVRRVSQWMHERADRLQFEVVGALGLQDVVVTFSMKKQVGLIITGYPSGDLPGAVTLSIREGDFTRVLVHVSEAQVPNPVEVCTMDYSWSGRRAEVVSGPHTGKSGELVVASTVGEIQNCRLRLDSGETITATAQEVELSGAS